MKKLWAVYLGLLGFAVTLMSFSIQALSFILPPFSALLLGAGPTIAVYIGSIIVGIKKNPRASSGQILFDTIAIDNILWTVLAQAVTLAISVGLFLINIHRM